MRRTKSLQLASAVLLITQFNLINSFGQTSLTKLANSAHLVSANETTDGPDSSSVIVSTTPTEESRSSSVTVLPPPSPTALTSHDPQKFGIIDRAYLDVFTILNDDNDCSRFFGGRSAVAALTELVLRLKPKYLEKNVALRMSGDVTTFQSHATGFTFRQFEKAEVNLSGSFFRNTSQGAITISFPPNTRETRAVVLLHELGHLIKSREGWVLPDDGGDQSLSLRNSERVVSICKRQIDSLSKLTPEQELGLTSSNKRPE